jgi:tetratricopeptide (TPR) repeat protein
VMRVLYLLALAALAHSQDLNTALTDLQKGLDTASPVEIGARLRFICGSADLIGGCELWALVNAKPVQGQANARALETDVAVLGTLRDLRRQMSSAEPENAMLLLWLGEAYFLQSNYAEAEPLFLRAADLLHPQGLENILRAEALNDLGTLREAQANYPAAIELFQEALKIRKESGPTSPLVAESLLNLAGVYENVDNLRQAEAMDREALAILEGTEPDSRRTAVALANLGDLCHTLANYGEAASRYLSALSIFEKLGSDSPDTAKLLDNLAGVYDDEGLYEQAMQPRLQALSILKAAFGLQNSDTAATIHNLGTLYFHLGDYKKAGDNYQQALDIREQIVGGDHPDTAATMDALAQTWVMLGEYKKAEQMYKRALANLETKLGPNDASAAKTMSNLGVLYVWSGDYRQAERLLKHAVEILKQTRAPDHPDTAFGLANLALLYWAQGAYAQVEPLRERALAIREKSQGEEHRDTAAARNDLAETYRIRKEYANAEPLYENAVATLEKVLPAGHPDIAVALSNLASLYLNQRLYEKARPMLERALAIETASGPNDGGLPYTLDDLARLCFEQKDYSDAVRYYARSLAAIVNSNGPDYPDVISLRTDFARALWKDGQHAEARDQLIAANRALARFWPGALVAVEQARRRSLVAKFDDLALVSLSMAQQLAGEDRAGATMLVALAIMTRKGILSSARQEVYARIRRERNPNSQRLLDQLSANAEQQGRAARLPPRLSRTRLAQLRQDEDRIERLLIENSGTFRQWRLPIDPGQITAALQQDTALIDLLRYPRLDLRTGGPVGIEYTAVVYRSGADRQVVFFGDARAIDDSVKALRQNLDNMWATCLPEDHCGAGVRRTLLRGQAFESNLYRTETDCTALYGLTMAKLLPAIEGRKGLLISPDGPLAEIPWEILRSDGYLIERGYRLRYLDSARSFVEGQPRTVARNPAVVIANVDYDAKPRITRLASTTKFADERLEIPPAVGTKWTPLNGGNDILRTLADLHREGRIGRFEKLPQGSEEEVMALREPNAVFAHTHGFFNAPTGPFEEGLTSGIILSGANHADEPGHPGRDGWLMAKEVMLVHLEGTQLVALFGCDTGLGTDAGEGVQGLRHALAVSGARSTLLTLWDVGDLSSARFLDELLLRLTSDSRKTIVQALTEVRLAFLTGGIRELNSSSQANRWRHPYFWAGATLSGRDGTLNLK